MVEYMELPEVEELAKGIISKLHWADIPEIKYLVLCKENSYYLGKCSKATGKWRYLSNVDYVIEVFEQFWNTATQNAKEALLRHELEHIEPKEDDEGNIKWGLKKHDVEEFLCVAKEYGSWNQTLVEFRNIFVLAVASPQTEPKPGI